MLCGCQDAQTASSVHTAAENPETRRQELHMMLERSQLELMHIFVCCYLVIHPLKPEG